MDCLRVINERYDLAARKFVDYNDDYKITLSKFVHICNSTIQNVIDDHWRRVEIPAILAREARERAESEAAESARAAADAAAKAAEQKRAARERELRLERQRRRAEEDERRRAVELEMESENERWAQEQAALQRARDAVLLKNAQAEQDQLREERQQRFRDELDKMEQRHRQDHLKARKELHAEELNGIETNLMVLRSTLKQFEEGYLENVAMKTKESNALREHLRREQEELKSCQKHALISIHLEMRKNSKVEQGKN